MHVFNASSLSATIKSHLGGVNKRRHRLPVFLGLRLAEYSARYPRKTHQHQLRKLLRVLPRSAQKNIIWHDVINNSVAPYSSSLNCPLGPREHLAALRSLSCEVSLIAYSNRQGSTLIYGLSRESFLTIHATENLLPNRKQKDLHLEQQYSFVLLDIRVEVEMYFLLFKNINDLQQWPKNNESPQSQAPPVTLSKTTPTTTKNIKTTTTTISSTTPAASDASTIKIAPHKHTNTINDNSSRDIATKTDQMHLIHDYSHPLLPSLTPLLLPSGCFSSDPFSGGLREIVWWPAASVFISLRDAISQQRKWYSNRYYFTLLLGQK